MKNDHIAADAACALPSTQGRATATRTGSIGLALALVAMAQPAVAQEVCQAEMAKMNGVTSSFESEQKQIEQEGRDIESDGQDIGVSGIVDIKMKDQHWAFDVPTVTMKDKKMALDLPQVTMKLRTLSWDEPVVVMKLVKTGEYPEFKCNGFKCTVKWSPIYSHVPTTEMRRREIKLDIPETKMNRTDLIMSVPEFKMTRQDWHVKVPEITINNLKVEAKELEGRGKDLQTRAEALATRMKTDTATASSSLYQCYGNDLQGKRAQVMTQFAGAIGQLDAAIKAAGAQGLDPSAMAAEGGTVNLLAQRQKLVEDQNGALAQIDAAITQLTAKQKEVTGDIIA
jgi:hypothetical protein